MLLENDVSMLLRFDFINRNFQRVEATSKPGAKQAGYIFIGINQIFSDGGEEE